MSISSVRVKLGSSWTNLTYNSASGRWEGSLVSYDVSSNQPGGYFSLDLEATNSSGKTATASGAQVPALRLEVVDATAPVLVITAPADGFVTAAGNVTVTGRAQDSSGLAWITVNGVSVTIGSDGSFSKSVYLTEGSNTITVKAADTVGNVSTETITGVRDSVSPVITLTAPVPGTIVDTPAYTVTGTVSDSGSGIQSVTVNGAAASVSGGNFRLAVQLQEGTNAIIAFATDNAGNSATSIGTAVLDTIAPELTVDSPAGDLITNTPELTVSGTASDANLDTVTVNGKAVSVSGGAYSTGLTLAEGSNTITVTATDAVGHVTTITRTVLLDTAPPVLTLVSPPEGWLNSRKPTVVFRAEDEAVGSGVDPATVEVRMDGLLQTAGVTVSDGLITFTPPTDLPEGGHVVITVTVEDRAGNRRGLSASYGVDTVPPHLELILPNSHRILDTETIVVAGRAWDDGSGVNLVFAVNAMVSVSTVPSANGAFELDVPSGVGLNDISVKATDRAGLSVSETIQVIRLVTDRTRADIERLQEFCRRGYSNWTEEERAWWAATGSRRGSYDAQDLERVNLAMEWLVTWLRDYGYLPVCDPDTREWTDEDVFDLPAETRLVRNTAGLRAVLPLEGDVPETPETVRDIGPANDVETILVAVDAVRPLIDVSPWTCGEITAGEF